MIDLEAYNSGEEIMKRFFLLLAVFLSIAITGCAAPKSQPQVVATTKPVYDFTARLCAGTGISVTQLITEPVSCLHDYSLSVSQARTAEAAEVTVISGAGLEEFMEDILHGTIIDSSHGIALLDCQEAHNHGHDHHHEADNHIWLSPENAKLMASNICSGLSQTYPAHASQFRENLELLLEQLDALQLYGTQQLSSLSCRELITFHDGFGYLADAFDLTIAAAVEEESGSEASAKELIRLIELIREKNIPAVFSERNGSVSAPGIISAETGVSLFSLDMAMSEGDYFESMYRNIDVLKEALG